MPTVLSVEDAKTQFSGLVDYVDLNKSSITVLRSGRPVVRIMPIRPRRNLVPDDMLMSASISDADLFDDCSSEFEHDLTIVTHDKRFAQYGVRTIT